MLTLRSSLAATIITPADFHIGHDFHISPVLSALPFGLYILGYALGFLIGPVISEVLSRKNALLINMLGFALLQLGVGLSRNVILLFCLECLSGVFGGVGSLVSASVLFDMYPKKQRAMPHGFLFASFFLGPISG